MFSKEVEIFPSNLVQQSSQSKSLLELCAATWPVKCATRTPTFQLSSYNKLKRFTAHKKTYLCFKVVQTIWGWKHAVKVKCTQQQNGLTWSGRGRPMSAQLSLEVSAIEFCAAMHSHCRSLCSNELAKKRIIPKWRILFVSQVRNKQRRNIL